MRRTIVHVIPSLVVGGAETFATWLAQAQLDEGHDVHIVCVSDGGPLASRLSPELRRRVWIARKRARYDATVLGRLIRTFDRLGADIVHTHLFTALAWGGVAARTSGVPVVVHTQHAVHADAQDWLPHVRRALAPLLDSLVACSAAVERDVAERDLAPGVPVVRIDNGLPLAGRPQAPLDGQPPHLMAAGRLVPIKGHRHLVDAVALLRRQGVHVRLTILGDGPLRDALERQIAGLGLEDRVALPGRVADVADRLATADLFVQPSLSEAMPLAVLEAAAAGLPLVVTSAGGCATLLEAGAGGVVVPPEDADALADAIQGLLQRPGDERTALGAASRELALRDFDMARCADAYAALYASLAPR